MKHLKLFFALFAMLALNVGNAWAETVEFDLTTKTQLTTQTANSVVFTNGGATLTITKNASGTAVNNYMPGGTTNASHTRVYKTNPITFDVGTGNKIQSVTVKVTSSSGAIDKITNGTWNPTVTNSGTSSPITYTLSTTSQTASVTPSGTSRIEKVTLTYVSEGGSTPEPEPDPDPTPDPEPDPTPEPGGEVASYTWDLTKASYSASSTSQVTWSATDVNMVLTKESSSTNADNYLGGTNAHTRVYKDQKITFTPAANVTITSIEIVSTSTDYASKFANSTWSNATAAASSSNVTITPSNGANAIICTITAATRASKVTVNYTKATSGEPEPVIVKTLKSIAVSGQKTTFEQGDVFKFDGTCTATYSVTKDGVAQADETKEVTPTSVSTPDMSTTGDKVVTVSYTEGEVTVETTYTITVTENTITPGTYPGNLNNAFFGCATGNNAEEQSGKLEDILVVSGCTQSAQTKTNYYSDHVRYYADNYLKFSAPTGYVLTAIQFTAYTTSAKWDGEITATVGTYDADGKSWTGSAQEVQFNFGKQNRIASVSVTYAEASKYALTITTPSNGTLTVKDGENAVATGDKFYAGTQLTVTATPEEGYKLASVSVVDGSSTDVTASVYDNGTLTMPEYDVTISATFVAAKTLNSIEITTPATQTTFWQGETFNSTGLVVTAHFDGSADEVVTPTVTGSTATAGTQTVTVSYTEGTVTKSTSYEITVKAIPNTKETAYSVADAYDIIDKLTTATGVFITGTISQVDSYNSTYKSITYWISADGTTTNQLQVYSGKGLESADFTAVTDLTVGDQVIVCGNLKKHNSTYEFDYNNYLAAYTPTTKDPAGLAYATTSYTANVGEPFTTPELTNPHNLGVTYATSDASKATVDVNTGAVTIVAVGEVTITASTTGDATHDAGSASYNITITDPSLAVATLPFYFDGKKADIEGTAGMTQSNLGSDYAAAPYLKFNAEGAWAIVQFDSEPGDFSFLLKQNGESIGTFTVYESENGEDYTPIWSGGDLGGNAKSATIEPTLSATARYVKFEYTTKPTGTNYGLGEISIKKADNRAEAGLAWNPANVSLTVGDAFTTPTFSNPNSLTVSFESSNTDLATVNNAGVISLVSGKTGTATITATYAGNETYKPAEVTCTITVDHKSEDVVILAKCKDQYYALVAEYVTDKNDVLQALPVAYINGKIYNVATDEQKASITWKRVVVDGKTTFQNGDNYLSAVNSAALKLEEETCDWIFENDMYKIEGADRTILYYATTGGFKNYSIGNMSPDGVSGEYSSTAITVAPVFADGDAYHRTVTARNYGTICLPFGSTNYTGATFFEIAYRDATGVYLDEVKTLVAGVPYIFQATSTEIAVIYEGEAAAAGSANGLYGTFTEISDVAAVHADKEEYILTGGVIRFCEGSCTVPANRAYIVLDEISTEQTPAPVNRRRISMSVHGENGTTGLDNIMTTDAPAKVIENGQLIIIRGGVKYNVQGQKL